MSSSEPEDQAHGAELVDGGDKRGGTTDAGDFFDHDAGGHGIGALAVVGLGDVDGIETRRVECGSASSGNRASSSTAFAYGAISFSESPRMAPQLIVVFEFEQIEIWVARHGNTP